MMYFKEGERFILNHFHLIKTPITFEKTKRAIGVNVENMIVFLSKDYLKEEKL